MESQSEKPVPGAQSVATTEQEVEGPWKPEPNHPENYEYRSFLFAPDQTPMPSMRSKTLDELGVYPQTVCVHCPGAVWMQHGHGGLTNYCLVLKTLVDFPLLRCDARPSDDLTPIPDREPRPFHDAIIPEPKVTEARRKQAEAAERLQRLRIRR